MVGLRSRSEKTVSGKVQSSLPLQAIYSIAGAAFALLMVHTVLNAIWRSVAAVPLADTTEYVSGWYMPIAVLTAILVAFLRNEHTRAGLIFEGLSDKGKKTMEISATVLQFVFVLAIAVAATQEASHSMSIGEHYGISDVLIWPVKCFLAAIFYFAAAVLVVRLVQLARSNKALGSADLSHEIP